MSGLRKGNSAQTLEAEILLVQLQGARLAKADGIQTDMPLCCYCGFPAEALDHVIPVKRQQSSRRRAHGPLVDACGSCNSHLHARIFPTFKLRLEFLRAKYEAKLRGVSDLWGEDELSELGPNLRRHVSQGIANDRRLETKLWWMDRIIRALQS